MHRLPTNVFLWGINIFRLNIQERSCHLSVLDDFVVLGKMQPDVDCVFNRVVLHDKPDDLDFIE